jgi:hypothetical protein
MKHIFSQRGLHTFDKQVIVCIGSAAEALYGRAKYECTLLAVLIDEIFYGILHFEITLTCIAWCAHYASMMIFGCSTEEDNGSFNAAAEVICGEIV